MAPSLRLACVASCIAFAHATSESCAAGKATRTGSLLQRASADGSKQEVLPGADSKQVPAQTVVVIGSGIGGLSAARTLLDNWPASIPLTVTVLEGSNRAGGRTFTNRRVHGFGSISGAEVDVGASWIHGSNPKHPITRIKDALKLKTFETKDKLDEVHVCSKTQTDACPEPDDSRYEAYEAMLDEATAKASASAKDEALWDFMGNVKNLPLVLYHITNALEFNVGASPQTMSGKYYNNDDQFKGPELLLLGGYSQVTDAMINGTFKMTAECENNDAPNIHLVDARSQKKIDVQLSKKVNSVSLSADGTKITVGIKNEKPIQADHVVVAVPLGVLKNGDISFNPALPQRKSNAIKNLGFGNVVKIGIMFDRVFWNPAKHYFGLAVANATLPDEEKFSYWLNTQPASGKPILFTFAFGSSAMVVEGMTDEALWAAARQKLVAIFGKQKVDSAKKVGMWRSSWGTDPFFRGAYSYSAVGSAPTDWTDIAAPAYGNRLHFAGEHTSKDYRGTVHGALISGQNAACEVLTEVADDEDEDDYE